MVAKNTMELNGSHSVKLPAKKNKNLQRCHSEPTKTKFTNKKPTEQSQSFHEEHPLKQLECHSLEQNVTKHHQVGPEQTESESFDIETIPTHSEEPNEESPQLFYSPLDEYYFQYTSNVPVNDDNGNNHNIRSTLPSVSQAVRYSFENYMQETLVRWRPSDSQQNVEASIDGNHPFHEHNFGVNSPVKASGFFYNWFKSKREPPNDVEKQLPCQSTVSHPPYINNNSSRSIPEGNGTMEIHSGDITNYTPRAIPFQEYELNYQRKLSNGNEINNEQIYDSMDIDMMNLISGTDNFCCHCIGYIKQWFTC